MLIVKLIREHINDDDIDILTTKERITIGRFDLEYTLANLQTEISKVPPPQSIRRQPLGCRGSDHKPMQQPSAR